MEKATNTKEIFILMTADIYLIIQVFQLNVTSSEAMPAYQS